MVKPGDRIPWANLMKLRIVMSPKTVFHLAILFSILLDASTSVIDAIHAMSMPENLSEYMDYFYAKEAPYIDVLLVWPILIANAIAVIGIAFFQPWARLLYIALFVFGLVYTPLVYGVFYPSGDFIISSEWSDFVSYYAQALQGFVLAMLLYGPIANEFEKRKLKQNELKD